MVELGLQVRLSDSPYVAVSPLGYHTGTGKDCSHLKSFTPHAPGVALKVSSIAVLEVGAGPFYVPGSG